MSLKSRLGMRIFLTIFLAQISVPASAQASPSPTGMPDFTLALVPPSGPFELGESIHLKVRLTNTTDHIVYVPVLPGPAWGDEIVGVDLTDGAGVPVPKWRDLEMQAAGGKRPISGGSFRSDNVPPREVHEREVRLEKVYKITETGHYTVRVSRGSDFTSFGQIRTN